MSYSIQRAASDGSLVLLGVSLEYFARDEITVYFNDVLNAYPWAWVGTTTNQISFTPAVPAGVEVKLVRTTDVSGIRNDFEGGAAFTDATLDENFLQVLRVVQEAKEAGLLADIYSDLNMHGYRVYNIGDPVAPTDAANLRSMNAKVAEATALKDAMDAIYDNFDDRYLGTKTAAPTADNDGNPLLEGALYWNSTQAKLYAYSAVAQTWNLAGGGGGATGATGNSVFYENDQHVTASYTITAGKNASSTGPLIIDPGVTVTIPAGSTWKVL